MTAVAAVVIVCAAAINAGLAPRRRGRDGAR